MQAPYVTTYPSVRLLTEQTSEQMKGVERVFEENPQECLSFPSRLSKAYGSCCNYPRTVQASTQVCRWTSVKLPGLRISLPVQMILWFCILIWRMLPPNTSLQHCSTFLEFSTFIWHSKSWNIFPPHSCISNMKRNHILKFRWAGVSLQLEILSTALLCDNIWNLFPQVIAHSFLEFSLQKIARRNGFCLLQLAEQFSTCRPNIWWEGLCYCPWKFILWIFSKREGLMKLLFWYQSQLSKVFMKQGVDFQWVGQFLKD